MKWRLSVDLNQPMAEIYVPDSNCMHTMWFYVAHGRHITYNISEPAIAYNNNRSHIFRFGAHYLTPLSFLPPVFVLKKKERNKNVDGTQNLLEIHSIN